MKVRNMEEEEEEGKKESTHTVSDEIAVQLISIVELLFPSSLLASALSSRAATLPVLAPHRIRRYTLSPSFFGYRKLSPQVYSTSVSVFHRHGR